MIVIADMGSTKTDWSFVDEDKNVDNVQTKGFNPYFYSTEQIVELLKNDFEGKFSEGDISEVHFYGAGCSNDEKCATVSNALKGYFPGAKVNVDHDLLASARALCGNNPGIACILGTGSNTCSYDGQNVVANNPSLGFLIGDEGSGGDLGRELIKYYEYGELGAELDAKFEKQFGVDRDSIIEAVYSTEHPNAYCASFAKFVNENKDQAVIQQLIDERMTEFYKRHVTKYDDYNKVPVNFIGSIAFHFSDELKRVGEKFGVTVGKIIKAPVDSLIDYHMN